MEEKRSELRSWQLGLAGLLGGAAVVAVILALWQPWVKLPPIGEVRGEILESDIKEIQKLTAQLAKDPIQSIERLETGAIEVTIEHSLEFFIFELVGDRWTMTSSGYYATSMGPPPPLPAQSIDMSGPRDAPWPSIAPAAATAPPSTFPAVDQPKMVDSIQYYKVAPASAVAPAAESGSVASEGVLRPTNPPPPRPLPLSGGESIEGFIRRVPRDAKGQDRMVPTISPSRPALPPAEPNSGPPQIPVPNDP
jgi:hypothetical protein